MSIRSGTGIRAWTTVVALALVASGGAVEAGTGDPDAAFGPGGTVLITDTNPYGIAYDAKVGPYGTIYAVGSDRVNNLTETSQWALYRLADDGTYLGKSLLYGNSKSYISGNDVAKSLAIDPSSGSIYIAGPRFVKTGATVHTKFTVAKFDPDGSFVWSYSANLAASSTGADASTSIVVQSNGQIVVGGGYQDKKSVIRPCLIRLNPNGTLDGSFGSAGMVRITSQTGEVRERTLRIASDGRLVFATNAIPSAIVRLSSNGAFQSAVQPAFPGVSPAPQCRALDLDSNDNPILLYYVGSTPTRSLVGRVLASNWVKDGSFGGGDGSWSTSDVLPGGTGSSAWALRVLANGKIVVASNYISQPSDANYPNNPLLLIGLNADGTSDFGFGPYGNARSVLQLARPGTVNAAYSLTIDANDNFLTAGLVGSGDQQPILARWLGR